MLCPTCQVKAKCDSCGTLFVPEDCERSDVTPLETLKSTFLAHPERHEGLEWEKVEKALTPEILAKVQWMEETGGEPDVLFPDKKGFWIIDCAAESPRKNLNYFEARKEIQSHGLEMVTWEQYEKMNKDREFDIEGWTWLESGNASDWARDAVVYRGGGRALLYVYGPSYRFPGLGVRCMLRVDFDI